MTAKSLIRAFSGIRSKMALSQSSDRTSKVSYRHQTKSSIKIYGDDFFRCYENVASFSITLKI